MGYTHYWSRQQAEIPLNKWRQAVEQIRPIIEQHKWLHGIERGERMLTDIELSDDVIWFNGQHETFAVRRVLGPEQFTFCKTERKAYDPIVVACLLILDNVLAGDPVGFEWSSDGTWPEEHSMGIEVSGLLQEEIRGPQ